MGEMELSPEAAQAVGDIITQNGGNMSDDDIAQIAEAGKLPKYPVITNPQEKNPDKLEIKPKLSVNEMRDEAEFYVVPDDLEGMYDYVADVESMAAGAAQELIQGRQKAFEALQNPQTLQLLAMEQKKPKVAELFISMLDDLGLRDAERFFEDAQPQAGMPQQGQPGMPQGMPQGQPMPSPIEDVNNILQQGSQVISSQPPMPQTSLPMQPNGLTT